MALALGPKGLERFKELLLLLLLVRVSWPIVSRVSILQRPLHKNRPSK